jgi:hypothetical protein
MPKRKNLNGLSHNLVKSFFGTLRYYGKGYMADWLLNAAKSLHVDKVALDILNSSIDPKEMEKLPLMWHLIDLKSIIEKELVKYGFDNDFIVEAKIKVEIPDHNIYARTLYCYPELIDKHGRKYAPGRFIETAHEQKFEPFGQKPAITILFSRIKRLFN